VIALVTGTTGLLGGYLVPELRRSGYDVVALGGPRSGGVDLCDRHAVLEVVGRVGPDVVVHAAALSAVAECARDPALARRINVEATSNVASAVRSSDARLVHVSTDMVFDGEAAPYDEAAPTSTRSVYGTTKRDAEPEALRAGDAVVARLSLLFGPTRNDRRGFFDQQLEKPGATLALFDDEWRTPLSLRAAAAGLAFLARSDISGTLHLGGPERMSRWDMGVRLAKVVGATEGSLARASRLSAPGPELRPRDLALDSSRFRRLFPAFQVGSFEEECARMLGESSSSS
jgi:dTDP-4-dehydrorhamnose reductase